MTEYGSELGGRSGCIRCAVAHLPIDLRAMLIARDAERQERSDRLRALIASQPCLRCAWKNFFTPVMEISPSHLPSLLAGTIRTEQDGWGARKVQEPADERDRLKLNRSISAVEALCAACFVLQH